MNTGVGRPRKASQTAAEQRTDAGRRHQEAVPGRVAVELIAGERRDDHAEVHADGRDEPDHRARPSSTTGVRRT